MYESMQTKGNNRQLHDLLDSDSVSISSILIHISFVMCVWYKEEHNGKRELHIKSNALTNGTRNEAGSG